MPKVKISEYSATANSNTDVASINIDEGCAPSGINNAIRAVMGHLKDFQQGTNGDPFNGPVNGTLGATTASTANVTTLTTSSTVTHNGGTINGVAYLNGSKVLTMGSALVFDASGNLGVGSASLSSASGRVDVTINGTSSSMVSFGTGGTRRGYMIHDGTDLTISNEQAAGALRWVTSAGESMRIATATGGVGAVGIGYSTLTSVGNNGLAVLGNVGIGTSSPGAKLDVQGSAVFSRVKSTATTYNGFRAQNDNGNFYFGLDDASGGFYGVANARVLYADGAYPMVFFTNATERARIDSSGNLYALSSVDGVVSASSLAAGTSNNIFLGKYSATTTTNGTTCYAVRTNGNVINTNNSYGAISDAKLKENIVDAKPKLANLMQVKVRNYNMIGDTTKQIGIVAQELETVFPSMIDEAPDKDAEGNDLGTTTKSVKYSVFVPILIKAIQEQQVLITTLTARISALESA